jgi:DNA-binding NtrC family response regulator
MADVLPRIAVIDDLFGRLLPTGINEDRENLCASFLLRDVTESEANASRQKIKAPIAEAVFFRGQKPACAKVDQTIENDLAGTMDFLRRGWIGDGPSFKRWSLVLLDLCFYTGRVTGQLSQAVAGEPGKQAEPGMPEGRASDIVPSQFFGLEVLRAVHDEFPDLPVVILSSQERGKVSEEFSAHGALAFLPRSNDDQGEELLRIYLDRHGLMADPHGLIVGNSLPLLKALRAARRTAYTDERENILIRGERGVGKEEFAKFIHRIHGTRASKDMIPVNSAVLTSELFQSELFGIGHRKATGVDKHEGAAIRADGGDLFFDEIKDMIPQAQAGILRFLEDGGFTPTGSKKMIESDVRVISATNADLETLAASGHFREDLLDRLRRGGTLVLPPLRDRKEDIPLLARSFVLDAESKKKGEGFRRTLSMEAMEYVADDAWPGNIRVLRDVMQKVVKDNDVEHIFPAQIEKARYELGLDRSPVTVPVESKRPIAEIAKGSKDDAEKPEVWATSATVKKPKTLSELIAVMRNFEFDLSRPDTLYNQLDTLDEAAAKLVVAYLLAALRMNMDHATGEPEITKAMQFITGNPKLKTPAAYDLVKRLMKRNVEVRETATEESLLRKAFEQAEAKRPTNRKKKTIPK